jgi:CubicO group peptidase (beta-lactamase class C family)
MTAAAFARLTQERKIDPLADVRYYVPEFPSQSEPINAMHLATHRSGIRSYRNDSEALEKKHYVGVIESLAQFKDDPLEFSPGMGFLYSGYGYVLLSAVIERAASQPFLMYMQHALFDTLGMYQTLPATSAGDLPGEATYYDNTTPYSTDGKIVISPPNDFSFKWAAGGFISTPEDLLKFAQAHLKSLNKNFFDETSLNMLFTAATRKMGGFIGWGMSWMVARDMHLRRVYFHFGAGSGGTSVLIIYPRQNVCIAILSNLGHARLPFNDLMSVINAFVPSTASLLMRAIAIMYLLIFAYWCIGKRLLRKKL